MKILNNLQLKSKLLLLAIPPFLIVGIYSFIMLSNLYNEKSNLLSTQNRILEAESFANLVHFLQIERGLSVGFIANNGQSNRDNILSVRSNVDNAISESIKVLKYTKGDISLLNDLNGINENRKNVDSLAISMQDVRIYYSKIIASFLNVAITTIPSLMNDIENRNAIQAYTHLASIKEALGQMRASLNAAFTNNKFIENTYGTFSASLGVYKINLDKFLILTPSKIATDYGKTFQGDVVDKTFEMIDIAANKGLKGDFNIDSVVWFETSTKSIDLLRKIELNLYLDVKSLIKNKIDTISYEIIMIISVILILIIIGIIITLLLTKNIITSLILFQNGFKSFFLYLNREKSDIEPIKLDSKDEFGEMAKVINENIEKIRKGIDEDRKLIDETIVVLSEFEQGDLCQRVELNVVNPALMQLKTVLNNMASNLENNIDNILKVLENYAHHNYLDKVDKQGIKKHLLKLANGVNTLGDSISTMLLSSLKDGKELQNEAENLRYIVELLSASTHEQAASLEETAAAMEEMTSNVQYNAQKADEMASMATQTDYSIKEQLELAKRTAIAMTDIQNSTNSISEVVVLIENIAFQTNILSLNAAVEAATAGDAGKGFAVVAQEVRNLANRSADAVKEIKVIAEQAVIKSNDGVNIANELTKGFEIIAKEIKQTTTLVQDVSNANREQMQGVGQINIAVTQLDQMTQENARIAGEADTIANATNHKAEIMLSNALSKEFVGKSNISRI